jgi:hypothetical protein
MGKTKLPINLSCGMYIGHATYNVFKDPEGVEKAWYLSLMPNPVQWGFGRRFPSRRKALLELLNRFRFMRELLDKWIVDLEAYLSGQEIKAKQAEQKRLDTRV